MKILLSTLSLFCVSFVMICAIFVSLSIAQIDPECVVGMWLFDEGAGKVAGDSSGKGNDGEFFGKPEWVDGKFGKALEFDGESAWVQIPDDPSLRVTTDVTVMAWIKPERYTFPGVDWQGVVAKSNNPRSYNIYTEVSGQFLLSIHSGGIHVCGSSGLKLPLDEWSHVAGVAEAAKAGGKMRLFTNGELTKEMPSAALKDLPGDSDKNDVVIGRTWEDQRFFGGLIDEVALFNIALTDEEIKRIASNGLEKGIGLVAVEPSSKLAATWGRLKNEP